MLKSDLKTRFSIGFVAALSVISNATAPNRRERPVRHVERYWLCDLCSPLLTLIFERGRGMVTIPLPVRNTYVSAAHLMQFQPAMRGYRAERSQKTL